MKRQAKRANPAQVQQHIQRQRDLGEKMVGGHDRVRWLELIATAIAVGFLVMSTFHGWPGVIVRWWQS